MRLVLACARGQWICGPPSLGETPSRNSRMPRPRIRGTPSSRQGALGRRVGPALGMAAIPRSGAAGRSRPAAWAQLGPRVPGLLGPGGGGRGRARRRHHSARRGPGIAALRPPGRDSHHPRPAPGLRLLSLLDLRLPGRPQPVRARRHSGPAGAGGGGRGLVRHRLHRHRPGGYHDHDRERPQRAGMAHHEGQPPSPARSAPGRFPRRGLG